MPNPPRQLAPLPLIEERLTDTKLRALISAGGYPHFAAMLFPNELAKLRAAILDLVCL